MKAFTYAVAVAVLAGVAAVAPASGSVTRPGDALPREGESTAYVTIAWGRSLWMHGCVAGATGVRTMEQNARDLRTHGLFGVGGIVVNRTKTTRTCHNGVTTTTWRDLARLRDVYGWSFVSQGMNYANMTTMTTDAQRYAETGATLAPLAAKGHADAWGAFLYANDMQDVPAQQVVSRYFAFGRLYILVPGFNTKAAITQFPHSMITYTPLGGRCNNPALPCYSIPVRNNRRTASPADVIRALRPAPGQWSVIQMFRFVEGKSGTLGQQQAWDCTSPDWRNRWTGIPENFCRNTWLAALAQRDKSVNVVTPAQMAHLWGRLPSG